MDISEFTDYKTFTRHHIRSLPKRGRGQYRQISLHLSVSSVTVSQVFRGDRDLTQDQAHSLCHYFGFSQMETKYYILMVELARAMTHSYKEYLRGELGLLKQKMQKLKSRLPQDSRLDEKQKAKFYSDWLYSGVRLATAIPELRTVEKLAIYFGLSTEKIRQIVEFLIESELCLEEGESIRMGPQRTHLESESPFIKGRQVQWRIKGFECMEKVSEEELFFTAPMVLSKDNIKSIRSEILQLIDKVSKTVQNSTAERLACLNIDWYQF